MKREFSLLNKEKKQKIVQELIDYVDLEIGEEIGVIAAQALLDFFLDACGNNIYNKGVDQALMLMRERMENMELDAQALLKREEA